MRKVLVHLAYPVAIFCFLFVVWYVLYQYQVLPTFVFPSLGSIVQRAVIDYELIFSHALYTFGMALLGLVIAIFFGFLLALLMDIFPLLHTIFYPIILLFQVVPIILFAPLLVVIFGYGVTAKLIVIVLMCFYPMLVTFLQGLRHVSQDFVYLIRSMGGGMRALYYWVKIPSSLTELFSGLRLSVSYVITASILSEWIGAVRGLGYIMIQSQRSFHMERMYVIIAVIFFLSTLFYAAVVVLERFCLPYKASLSLRNKKVRRYYV